MADTLTCFPGFCLQCSEALRQCVTFQHDLPKGQAVHHADNTTFHQAVDSDCNICLRIQRDLWTDRPFVSSAWESQRHNDHGHLEVTFIVSYMGTAFVPSRDFVLGLRRGTWTTMIVDVTENAGLITTARASLSQCFTGALEVKDLAAGWLRTCLDHHTDCNEHSETSWYPTRLLDVAADPVRLIETNHHRPAGPYATMSHRWGVERFTKLTDSNYEDFKQGISAELIAQSFKDIIDLARHMGIQYLWIDSFCVVQDSTHDWRQQSNQMCEIYSHAVMNIAVTHAASPFHGCYAQRRSTPLPPRIIYVPIADMSAPRVVQVYDLSALIEYEESLPRTLFGRAWVFQERFLAKRMLHFTQDRIYWECSNGGHHHFASEECPLGTVYPPYPLDREWSTAFILPPYSGPMPIHPRKEAWSEIVRTYSRLELTYPDKDKLPALAGVAAALSVSWQDEYVLGMFRQLLPRQLAWYALGGKRTQTCSRAPSWSWASVDGEVLLPSGSDEHPLLSIDRIDCQDGDPEDSDAAPVVATLHLKGQFIAWSDVKEVSQLRQDDESNVELAREGQSLLLVFTRDPALTDKRPQTPPSTIRSVIVTCLVLVHDADLAYRRVGRLDAFVAAADVQSILATKEEEVRLV